MTSRERNLAILHGEVPDCVPCCPDISNMVPAKMTGRPFWQLYAYQDPPLWKAHIAALKFFDLDGGFEISRTGDFLADPDAVSPWEERIVKREKDGAFVSQNFNTQTGAWMATVSYYQVENPPVRNASPKLFGLPPEPTEWEPFGEVKQWPKGLELYKLIREEMGDRGVVGMSSGMTTCMIGNEAAVYAYFDDPKPFYERREQAIRRVEERMEKIAQLEVKPDFLTCGGSGSLIWQTPDTVRELVLPVLKRTTELAHDLGIPTHVHSCGPETELVKMAALETKLTIIDPLEVPPMGDCNLAELKRLYGDKIVLKGNLHTTEVMLRGSVDDVVAASRKAIDDGAAGGGFILSTGDQCGRDTPYENIRAMVEVARTYGRY